MSFLKKLLTGVGSKILDPLGLWGDDGKAADAAERRHKETMAQADKAAAAAKSVLDDTLARQKESEAAIATMQDNSRALSEANAKSVNMDNVSNVQIGGTADSVSSLRKKKAKTSLASSLGINI